MDLIVAKDLSDRSYILSGKKAFFHRFCDTGFKNKWCGLWAMPFKFLDYFAFSVNGKWLSPENCVSFSYNEASASHQFRLDELSIKEFLFVPEETKVLVCILTLQGTSEQKEIKLGLEIALNIRKREENWNDRIYETRNIDEKIIINSEKGSFVFGSFPPGNSEFIKQYKEHSPGGERQRCFIPALYSFDLVLDSESRKDLFFVFSCGSDEADALENYEKTMKFLVSGYLKKENKYLKLIQDSTIDTGIDYLDHLFKWSVMNLEKLAFDSDLGFGFFAGLPWFTQFWGRDMGWILPAVVDYGRFEAAKESLRTLAKFQTGGCIPNVIYMDGRVNYNSIDATPLWIIALNYYIKNSGDLQFLNEMNYNLLKAVEWCKQRKDRDGFLKAEANETWMDTIDRKGKPIEVQVFWIEALKSAGNLLKLIGDDRGRVFENEARKLEKKFERKFWNEEERFYFDKIDANGKIKTINPLFALVFGLSENSKQVLERIESKEFSSPFGIRTTSKNENIYNPMGYHTGSAWGWITALAACAEFKNSNTKKGLDYLKMLFDDLNQRCVGAIGEAWNSENNNPVLRKKNMKEEGCCLQGWSSALVIRAIDEYMLGIKIDSFDRTIIVSPSLLNEMKVIRTKRIGNDFVDLSFKRRGSNLEVNYRSIEGKEYKIVKVPKL